MLTRLPLFVRTSLLLGLGFSPPVLSLASSPPQTPVTTRNDAAGKLVNAWFAEGTAAGNRGDRYDNRDNGHSALNLAAFPQLQPVAYSPEEVTQHRNQGPASAIHPFPTIGNASLAAPATNGGSLPRILTFAPNGLRFLQASYLANNLYIYPEHQDHDPGLGDLFPLNSPCVLTSQGSSGSDQAFLEALALTMASFQPAVKEELVRDHLLAPTLQFILRSSLKPVQSRDDYLSGVAHPSAFPPEWLDPERMVRMAHEMIRATIPPLVQLTPLSDSPPPRPGIDFFEPSNLSSEVLANELSVIARVFRAKAPEQIFRVSAARTADLLGRPLRVTWRLLRGDPSRVTLEPSPSGHEVQIRVRYQPEPLPVPGRPEIRSTRIDIGAFADNGISLSAPAFVCIYLLPSEQRVFDEKGRLLQIDYQAPSRSPGLPPADSFRWAPLLELLWNPQTGWAGQFLAKATTDAERATVKLFAGRLEPLIASKRKLESQLQSQQETTTRLRAQIDKLQEEAKKNPALLAEVERQKKNLILLEEGTQLFSNSTRSSLAALDREWELNLRSRQSDNRTLVDLLGTIIDRLLDSPEIYPGNRAMLETRAESSLKPGAAARLRQIRQRLVDRRILLPNANAPDQIVSCAPLSEPMNRFYLRALNRTILSDILLPDVIDYSYSDELADPRLTIPKPWRDVFVYDPNTGELRGWERMQKGEITQYDSLGRRITPQGPVPVSYQTDPQTKRWDVVTGNP